MSVGRISRALVLVFTVLLVDQCQAGADTCSGGGSGCRRAGAFASSEQGGALPEGGLARLEAAMGPQEIEVCQLFRCACRGSRTHCCCICQPAGPIYELVAESPHGPKSCAQVHGASVPEVNGVYSIRPPGMTRQRACRAGRPAWFAQNSDSGKYSQT